jgi:hypothetical protein
MPEDDFTGRYDEPWVQEQIDDTRRRAKAMIVDFLIDPDLAKRDELLAIAVEHLGVDELIAWAQKEQA